MERTLPFILSCLVVGIGFLGAGCASGERYDDDEEYSDMTAEEELLEINYQLDHLQEERDGVNREIVGLRSDPSPDGRAQLREAMEYRSDVNKEIRELVQSRRELEAERRRERQLARRQNSRGRGGRGREEDRRGSEEDDAREEGEDVAEGSARRKRHRRPKERSESDIAEEKILDELEALHADKDDLKVRIRDDKRKIRDSETRQDDLMSSGKAQTRKGSKEYDRLSEKVDDYREDRRYLESELKTVNDNIADAEDELDGIRRDRRERRGSETIRRYQPKRSALREKEQRKKVKRTEARLREQRRKEEEREKLLARRENDSEGVRDKVGAKDAPIIGREPAKPGEAGYVYEDTYKDTIVSVRGELEQYRPSALDEAEASAEEEEFDLDDEWDDYDDEE